MRGDMPDADGRQPGVHSVPHKAAEPQHDHGGGVLRHRDRRLRFGVRALGRGHLGLHRAAGHRKGEFIEPLAAPGRQVGGGDNLHRSPPFAN